MEPSKEQLRIAAFQLTKEAQLYEASKQFEEAATKYSEVIEKLTLLAECIYSNHSI